jgi:hypothetical protein
MDIRKDWGTVNPITKVIPNKKKDAAELTDFELAGYSEEESDKLSEFAEMSGVEPDRIINALMGWKNGN